ncbi:MULTISPECIES: AAA family ATPase [unclassified Mesorhizobium]|uniref:AAA family ATPase n=1 Tax=unclassified Mesorhizobium TaxID=325217 RepID=UPI003014D14D
MQTDSDRFFILTGGPGSGKTTLIESLRAAGYRSSVEAGRGIIQDQVAISGPALPWNDPALFAELMLSWEMRSHDIAMQETGPVFFDRGVPDVIGYLRLTGLPVPAHIEKAAEAFRYNRKVFVLPPWPEIFHPDAERKQDLDEARRTYEAMVETYAEYGYELITVPPAPVQERLSFVLAKAGF